MRIPALAAAAVLVFGLSACGTSTDQGSATSGQDTADAAGQAFVRAFGSGDAKGVCAVMATGQKPIQSQPMAVDQCATMIQGTMDVVKDRASQLSEATVGGATVSGTTATFENATVTPELAKTLLDTQSAVQIDDRWYISVAG